MKVTINIELDENTVSIEQLEELQKGVDLIRAQCKKLHKQGVKMKATLDIELDPELGSLPLSIMSSDKTL